MIKAGIDFSLTSPSVCIGEEGQIPTFHGFKKAKKDISNSPHVILYDYPEWQTQQERYEKLATWVFELVKNADHITMEGYAMGANGRIFDIAEATELVKYFLYKYGKEIEIVSPNEVKKFATGKGNAGKNQMAIFFLKQPDSIDIYGIMGKVFDPEDKKGKSPMSDMIDAYWMRQYGKV